MTESADPADVIAVALAQLRGRRGPRGPWGGDHKHGEHEHPRGPFGRGMPPGPPPWAMGRGHGGPGGGLARFRMLEALVSASGPLSVSEIAEAVGVDQPRASRLVQQSVELGLVVREADPDDARRTRIALTEQGRAIVQGFRGERREAIATALAGLEPDEQREFARLLTKFAGHWPH